MNFLIASLITFLAASVFSLLSRGEKPKILFSCFGVVVGSLLGLLPAVQILSGEGSLGEMWFSGIPGLTLALGVDALSAFFLAAIFFLSILISIYSIGYLKGETRLISSYPFFPILVGAMAAVVIARDGFLFVICWEVMSLASYFLVSVEHDSREVRYAGWIYLIATHLATAFLMVFFILLWKNSGSFLFEDALRRLPLSPSLAGMLFVFAVIGFGTKAGLFPFHVWLPHAHPAAPSPISALMSGVMIKTGIYGILRTLTLVGGPELWWGGLLMILGMLSIVLGILYAFVQEDIKRLLAYSSVENIGIITVAIGLGVMGLAWPNPWIATLGFAGALFHIWNHALFKGILFLSAGNVVRTAHTRQMSLLGGLLKPMPVTGALFFVASAAICGFPLFNGFISEWLIYLGLFQGGQDFNHFSLFLAVAGVVALAFAGGLAIAVFSKAFGVIFLGNCRNRDITKITEVPASMQIPILILGLLSLGIGFVPQMIWGPILLTVQSLHTGFAIEATTIVDSLATISRIVAGIVGGAAVLFLIRYWILRKKPVRLSVTWDCGYIHPTPRMQYGAASFAEPISTFFKPLLKPILHSKHFTEYYGDLAEERFFVPLFKKTTRFFSLLRRLQKSQTQDYLALMFVTLILLLLWEVWFGI